MFYMRGVTVTVTVKVKVKVTSTRDKVVEPGPKKSIFSISRL